MTNVEASAVRLHACRPEWEHALLDELGRHFPTSKHKQVEAGWIRSELSPEDAAVSPCLGFSTQCVPVTAELSGASIQAWAEAAVHELVGKVTGAGAPWRLHVVHQEFKGSPVRQTRCDRIHAAILADVHKRAPQLFARLVEDNRLPFSADDVLLQVALVSPEQGAVSLLLPEELHRLRRVVSRFPMGLAPFVEDTRPPSRAHIKLQEAQAHLGRKMLKGTWAVDLGASPGGWTFVAVEQGLNVIAVDRSPLRKDLMENSRVRFLQEDAFEWRPTRPLDWLLCDVIAFPQRTAEMLEGWLARGWCRNFIVTVKFRGDEDYKVLERIKRMLERRGTEFCIRHLQSNKNEVTVMGSAAPAPAAE